MILKYRQYTHMTSLIGHNWSLEVDCVEFMWQCWQFWLVELHWWPQMCIIMFQCLVTNIIIMTDSPLFALITVSLILFYLCSSCWNCPEFCQVSSSSKLKVFTPVCHKCFQTRQYAIPSNCYKNVMTYFSQKISNNEVCSKTDLWSNINIFSSLLRLFWECYCPFWERR